jgi:sugar/nucleoside kinase (ribokinase family)
LEFEFLQKDWIKDFPLLLVTCDERGYEIYRYGKRRFVNIIPMEVDDSIGAGDTFFAAFSLKYFETRDAFSSAEFAHEITKEFLNKKSG